MAKSDGTVYVNTLIDTKGFGKGVNTMQKQIGGLSGAVGKLGTVIAATFAVGKLIQFGKEAIDLGSDLQEVQNVVDVTFTTMNEQVNEFAKNAAETAGLSETMAKRYTGTFGAMAKAFGFAESEAFNMSTSLTQLAGDVASFYNLTQDEAYTKLKSVFTGETETLKDLGVVMTQNALDSYAMAEGYGKTTKQMSEQEKVALRYSFVLDQLSAASGDFVRTQDSWANQTRILSLNFDSFKANIGQALINIFTPFLKVINQIVAKMAELSSSFVTFSEMIFGKSISGGGGSPPSEVLGEVAGGYENIEEAATGAKKAQDKYLSGLDEIRTFTESTDSGAAAVGGGIDLSNVTDSKGEIEETETAVSALVERMKDLVSLFKEGFSEGLGDTEYRLQSLKDSVDSIKDSFAFIFDEKLADGFNNTVDRVVQSLGVISGSVASIGLTIATNLVGGFSKYLEDNKERIKQYLLDMFDVGAAISEKIGELSSTFAYIFEEFASEAGQQLTANLVGMFANSFMNISLLASQLGLDILTLITEPIKNSKENIRSAFGDLLAGYEEYTGSIKQVLDEVFLLINQTYAEYISPIFERLIPELEKTWQEHVAPLVSNIGNFFKVLGESISLVWNKNLKPAIEWIGTAIMPVVSSVVEFISNQIINNLLRTIVDATNGITEILKGIVEFIAGVLALDIKSALQGIVDIFEGIFETIEAIVGFFVDSIINKTKQIIDTISGIGSNVIGFFNNDSVTTYAEPTAVKSYNMPYLATGAVIPPNAPFMAVLGDQRHGTNIEAPEELLRKVVREESGSNRVGGSYTFQGTINRRVLFEEFIEEAKLQMSMTGHNPLDLRT